MKSSKHRRRFADETVAPPPRRRIDSATLATIKALRDESYQLNKEAERRLAELDRLISEMEAEEFRGRN